MTSLGGERGSENNLSRRFYTNDNADGMAGSSVTQAICVMIPAKYHIPLPLLTASEVTKVEVHFVPFPTATDAATERASGLLQTLDKMNTRRVVR